MTDFGCLRMFVCRSMILSKRVNDDDRRDGFTRWPFMTTHAWGEYPQGDWLLEVSSIKETFFYLLFCASSRAQDLCEELISKVKERSDRVVCLKLRFRTNYIVLCVPLSYCYYLFKSYSAKSHVILNL